jgi:hypothetical protein
MTEPSNYELAAWSDIQRFKGRPISRVAGIAGEKVVAGAAELGKRATRYLDDHPRAQSAVSRGQAGVAKGAQVVNTGIRKATDALPDGVVDWSGTAFESLQSMVARASRVGLSSKRVVARHTKLGHEVTRLSDLRRLDLEQIDAVRGRRGPRGEVQSLVLSRATLQSFWALRLVQLAMLLCTTGMTPKNPARSFS